MIHFGFLQYGTGKLFRMTNIKVCRLTKNYDMDKIFICGGGGGLDIVNCIPFYLIEKEKGNKVVLGSIRPTRLSDFFSISKSSYTQVTQIYSDTKISVKGRYAEPLIAKILGCDVFMLSRRDITGKYNCENLVVEFDRFLDEEGFDKVIFVDGGGDSLILRPEDALDSSQEKDPFKGGDAFTLKMINGLSHEVLWTIVAPGIDINYDKFIYNVDKLKELNQYVHSDILTFELQYNPKGNEDNLLQKYNKIIKQILVLKEEDLGTKIVSHTATTLYYALNMMIGIKRTFADWEGEVNGQKGIMVSAEMMRYYVIKANNLHKIKEILFVNKSLEENLLWIKIGNSLKYKIFNSSIYIELI